MDTKDTKHTWIRPLLSELELTRATEEVTSNAQGLWDELNRSNLLVRLREVAPLINKEAGQQVLHVQWFMPPQKVVCTFRWRRDKTEYGMQLALRKAGPVLLFFTKRAGSYTKGYTYNLYRYISGTHSANVKYRLVLRPAQVTDQDIEGWFTYLLSGLQDSYRPSEASAA